MMRGYSYLRRSNKLKLITQIKDNLSNECLTRINDGSSKIIFGAGHNKSELIVRQYLLANIGGISLNEILLQNFGKSDGKLNYTLPLEWLKVLGSHGFKFNKTKLFIVWYFFIIKRLCFGIAYIAGQIFRDIKGLMRSSDCPVNRYAYFEALTAGNLPQYCSDGKSYDIISWYLQWSGSDKNLNYICHNVKDVKPLTVDGLKIIYIQSSIQPLRKFSKIISYIFWGFKAIFVSTFDVFRGRWWHALMLSEAARSAKIRIQDAERLPTEILFNNSGWIYRPLWTYEAEKRGSRIIFYFYSTNCENFKLKDDYPIQANSWQVLNWPYYLVWDQYQADFLNRTVGPDINLSIVGPIWFHNTGEEIQKLPARSVAVFDVQPFRDSKYQSLGMDLEYYVPSIASKFLLDVHEVIQEYKCKMILKRKRHIGGLLHKKYGIIVEQLSKSDHFISINPNISAIRVIDNCSIVISMPFTSTAILGIEKGKPSIYYDPSGVIHKDDRAAHGIPVLSGIDELRTWFQLVV